MRNQKDMHEEIEVRERDKRKSKEDQAVKGDGLRESERKITTVW